MMSVTGHCAVLLNLYQDPIIGEATAKVQAGDILLHQQKVILDQRDGK